MKLGTTTQSRHADLVLQDVVTSHPCRTLPTGFLLPSLFLSCSAAQGGQVGKAVAQHQTLNQGAAAPDTHNAAPTKQNIYIYIYMGRMLGGREGWRSCLPQPTANTGTRHPSLLFLKTSASLLSMAALQPASHQTHSRCRAYKPLGADLPWMVFKAARCAQACLHSVG